MSAEIVIAEPLATALQAHRLLFLKKIGPRACVLLPLTWVVALALCAVAPWGPWACLGLALALLATVLPPVAFLSGRRMLKRSFNSVPAGAYAYTLDEQGVRWRSPIGSSEVHWSGFTRVYRFDTLWVLLIAERQFIALPADELDESSKSLVLENIKPKKGRVA